MDFMNQFDQNEDMCKLTELKGSVNIVQATWSENGEEQILRSYTKVLLSEDGSW